MATTVLFDNLAETPDTEFDQQYVDSSPDNGQSFMTGTSTKLTSVEVSVYGSGPGTLTAYLYTDNNDAPGLQIANLGTISNASIGGSLTSPKDITFSLANIPVSANSQYYIVLEDTVGNAVGWTYAREGQQSGQDIGVSGTSFVYPGGSGLSNSGTPWVMEVTACYCHGTLIASDRGDIAVEDLRIGDRLVTASGAVRPIIWIGRRSYDEQTLPAHPHACPIRFRAGSLGDGLPRRDLLVSPEHCMFIDGVLIPAHCLVNGASIVRDTEVARVDYFHIELDSHDVLFAEGAPSESFRDAGNRAAFDNAATYRPRWGLPSRRAPYAPIVTHGPDLETIRGRLDRGLVKTFRIGTTGRYSCRISPDIAAIRLVSPIGHDASDARPLGIAVSGIALDGVAMALDDARFAAGWHKPEHGWRWSDGGALVVTGGARTLELTVVATPEPMAQAA